MSQSPEAISPAEGISIQFELHMANKLGYSVDQPSTEAIQLVQQLRDQHLIQTKDLSAITRFAAFLEKLIRLRTELCLFYGLNSDETLRAGTKVKVNYAGKTEDIPLGKIISKYLVKLFCAHCIGDDREELSKLIWEAGSIYSYDGLVKAVDYCLNHTTDFAQFIALVNSCHFGATRPEYIQKLFNGEDLFLNDITSFFSIFVLAGITIPEA